MEDHELATDEDLDLSAPRRTKVGVAVLVTVIMLLIAAGVIRVFTPDFAARVVETVLNTFSVTVTTPPMDKPPPPPRAPEESGKSGNEGKKAVPRDAVKPPVNQPIKQAPAPINPGKGNANTSGASQTGNGTGAGGPGNGPGNGAGGNGSGGGAVVKPSVRSGEINDSRDFPVPPGGRQVRFGKRVIVFFTVTVDGRAKNCRVGSSGVDADTTARVCPLVIQKIRFNPARTADGTPVESQYGYKVEFNAR